MYPARVRFEDVNKLNNCIASNYIHIALQKIIIKILKTEQEPVIKTTKTDAFKQCLILLEKKSVLVL